MRRALLLLSLISALAAAAAPDTEPPAAPRASPEILKEFQAIDALAEKSAYPEAVRKARELLPRLRDEPAARALLLRNIATLHALQKHYPMAAESLEQSLELNALPPGDTAKALFELGQYHAAAGNLPKAAEAFSGWMSGAIDPKPEQILLAANVRIQLEQYAEAAALLEKAIAASPEPKPEWYQLLLGLYHESRDFQGCGRVLAELIRRSPDNAQYWRQLTGIYQEAGNEQQAVAVRQLMYEKGLLKSSAEIVQLAQVLRYRGLPSRAADLLQREIERGGIEQDARNYELLADACIEAKELPKASAALEKAAALSGSAETYHRLGQIYSELHDWSKARQALNRALSKGGLQNPGGAYLLLGMAHYRLHDRDEAVEAFTRAEQSSGVRRTAQQWLEHIERETAQRRQSH